MTTTQFQPGMLFEVLPYEAPTEVGGGWPGSMENMLSVGNVQTHEHVFFLNRGEIFMFVKCHRCKHHNSSIFIDILVGERLGVVNYSLLRVSRKL